MFSIRFSKIKLTKYNGYQSVLACFVYRFFNKETGPGANANEEITETSDWKTQMKKSLCEIQLW